jgi:hypothetical protein
MIVFTILAYSALVFQIGSTFGQWHLERSMRITREHKERTCVLVSIPTNEKSASKLLRYLTRLMEDVENGVVEDE